jgi:hypothetical protein
MSTNVNHGCSFTWCVNDADAHEVNRLEHFSIGAPIPATGTTLVGCEDLPLVRIASRFNEDLDPAPSISLNISGGRPYRETEVDLRADEAVLLYDALGAAIQNLIAGTNLDPAKIIAFYKDDGAATG